MNNLEENSTPLFENSTNRLIMIDKEDYILSYKHNTIENYSDESVFSSDLDIGKFYLTMKQSRNGGPLVRYTSPEKIFIKDSINANVLNNDKYLIKKIVLILEGKLNVNQSFKIENNKVFKINLGVKSINIVMFSCELIKTTLSNYEEVLQTCMRFFKNKTRLIDKLEAQAIGKEKQLEDVSKEHAFITRKIASEEEELVKNLCSTLNKKKEIIRKLQGEIDGVEEVAFEKEESNILANSSLNKSQEEQNHSYYSLTDLL